TPMIVHVGVGVLLNPVQTKSSLLAMQEYVSSAHPPEQYDYQCYTMSYSADHGILWSIPHNSPEPKAYGAIPLKCLNGTLLDTEDGCVYRKPEPLRYALLE